LITCQRSHPSSESTTRKNSVPAIVVCVSLAREIGAPLPRSRGGNPGCWRQSREEALLLSRMALCLAARRPHSARHAPSDPPSTRCVSGSVPPALGAAPPVGSTCRDARLREPGVTETCVRVRRRSSGRWAVGADYRGIGREVNEDCRPRGGPSRGSSAAQEFRRPVVGEQDKAGRPTRPRWTRRPSSSLVLHPAVAPKPGRPARSLRLTLSRLQIVYSYSPAWPTTIVPSSRLALDRTTGRTPGLSP
jgi:hypothetical protein